MTDEQQRDHGGSAWERCVESLYREHRAGLVGIAGVLVDDREVAEELVQDVFASLLARRRTPQQGAELAYVRRAVLNRAKGELRRRRIRRAAGVPEPEEAYDVDRSGRRLAVLSAIRRLPRRQTECVVLRFYAGLTDEEAAAVLGISPGSVKQHLHRARRTLTGLLSDT